MSDMNSFAAFSLTEKLLQKLAENEWTAPTEIQSQVIPILVEGHDLMASARTGSGKTGAFMIPMLSVLGKTKQKALIMVPTRELGTQVADVFSKIAPNDIRNSIALLIGGSSMGLQAKAMQRNPRVIVATPGRLLDWASRGKVKLSQFDFVVIDEADRMLDFGFMPQLQEILEQIPETKQLALFTATMPKQVQGIARDFLKNPKSIRHEESLGVNDSIQQEVIEIQRRDKPGRLLEEVQKREGSILIFVKTQMMTDVVAEQLIDADVRASAMHGGKTQRERERALSLFREERVKVLVATDVASRGIDVDHVEHVINYDIPFSAEDYVHRIGRTGRAGRTGNSLSFVSPNERGQWSRLTRMVRGLVPLARGPRAPGKFTRQDRPFAPREERPFVASASESAPETFVAAPVEAPAPVFEKTAPSFSKSEPSFDKPARSFDRPRSFGDRPARPFGDRPGRSAGSRPFGARSFDGEREFRPRSFEERPERPFGKRSFGERENSFDRPRSFGDRPARSFDRPFGGERAKPFERRERGSDEFGGAPVRKHFKSDDASPYADRRKPFSRDGGGERPFRKPFGARDEGGFKKPFKKSFDGEGGFKKPFGADGGGFKKPYAKGEGKPFKKFADKPLKKSDKFADGPKKKVFKPSANDAFFDDEFAPQAVAVKPGKNGSKFIPTRD